MLYDRLKTGDKLPVCVVNRFMNDLIMRLGIPYRKKVTAKMIGIYFEYKEVRTNKQRFIELGKRIIFINSGDDQQTKQHWDKFDFTAQE